MTNGWTVAGGRRRKARKTRKTRKAGTSHRSARRVRRSQSRYHSIKRKLLRIIRRRIASLTLPSDVTVVRFPVGLFFARGDRAGRGSQVAEEVRSSFEYWNQESAEHLDVLFPGWYWNRGNLKFNRQQFAQYRAEIESRSRWQYTGETDLVLLNFDYDIGTNTGAFAFDEVILLPIETLLNDGRLSSIDAFMTQLVRIAKSSTGRRSGRIWDISKRIAFLRGRRSTWRALKAFVLRDFARVADEIEPFGVRDLRRES